MTPDQEAELQRTLGSLLASSETVRRQVDALHADLDNLHIEVTKISALHAVIDRHTEDISELTAFKNRAIGRGSVIAGIGAVVGAAMGYIFDSWRH